MDRSVDHPAEIGVLVYPGAQLAAVHGLTDLFEVANRLADGQAGPGIAVSHWSLGDRPAVRCDFRSPPGDGTDPDVVIVPPTIVDPLVPTPAQLERIAGWLLTRHADGALLVSICSGVILVAETGLLDGRRVSTHRNCAGALARDYPAIAVDVGERIIEHPGVLTAGGFMAWVDVGLLLVERLHGKAVRDATARFILPASDGAAERPGAFVPPRDHADAAVRVAQDLVHQNDGQGVSLAAMAAAAGLERRTFIRRFAGATGLAPIAYCRAVRIARARELLEGGNLALKEIAENLGYDDVGSFARAFRRVHGQPPGAYRKLYGGAVAMGAG
jgi:transcriptional regulator GlxA family with amidase domain